MSDLFALSSSDLVVLRQLIERERQGLVNPRNRPWSGRRIPQAPEVYAVKTPSTGIPARVGLRPGSVVCTVQDLPGPGYSALDAVTGLTILVYNLDPINIPGNSYVPVARDKFGRWWATCEGCPEGVPGSFTGTGTGTSSGTGTGTVPDIGPLGCCPDDLLPSHFFARFSASSVANCVDTNPGCFPAGSCAGLDPQNFGCPALDGASVLLHYQPNALPGSVWTTGTRIWPTLFPYLCTDDLVDTGIRIQSFETLRVMLFMQITCYATTTYIPEDWQGTLAFLYEIPSAASDPWPPGIGNPAWGAGCDGSYYPRYYVVPGGYIQLGYLGTTHSTIAANVSCNPFCLQYKCVPTWLGCWNGVDPQYYHFVDIDVGNCPPYTGTGTSTILHR